MSIFKVNGLFLVQGMHMRLPTMIDEEIPAAWLQLVNVITVLLLVPVIDRFVYPKLDSLFERAPHLFRMSIGKCYILPLIKTEFYVKFL